MFINQKIKSLTKNRFEWLVVDIHWDSQLLALSDLIVDRPKRPFLMPIDEVTSLVKSKLAETVEHDFPNFLLKKDHELSENDIKKRNEALEALSPILESPETRHRYLFGDSFGIVADLIHQSGRSKKFVTSNLNKYFYYGGFKNALLPGYYKCGQNYAPPLRPVILKDGTPSLASKRGRRTKYGEEHRGITQQDIDNIKAFSKHIPSGEKVVLEDLFRRYCSKHFMVTMSISANGETRSTKEKVLLPERHLISKRSFVRQLKKVVRKIDFIRKRVGPVSYDRNHKGKPGVARQGLRGATSRYEIDATIADVYIQYIFSKDKSLATGRPVIFLVIDSFSGMIVGLHVCFDGPNWHGASQALFNAMTSKVDFCAQYGIEISEEEWPCQHVCSEITFDRGGENSDTNLSGLVKVRSGINIINVAAYHRGDAKGIVEKTFDILQESSIKFEAGKVIKAPSKEEPHASNKAIYTMDEFMRILIQSILLANRTQLRKNTHNFEMEQDDVLMTPLDIWNWSIKNSIISPKISKGRLRMTFLPEKEATITDKGVLFNGLYYNSEHAMKHRWYDIAKNEGRRKISVRYTSTSTNHIWYQDEDSKEIIKFDLTTRSEAYKNVRWEHVMHRLEIVKQREAMLRGKRRRERIYFDQSIEELEREIKNSRRHMAGRTAKGVQPGMKERQKTESALERQRDYQNIVRDLSELTESSSNEDRVEYAPYFTQQNLDDPNEISWEDFE
jgi:hypothetical protein|tara:strand:- start:1495 stop:3687 length:2193 start_codon:yes stop_codon:yes gene_type:complete